MDNKIGKILIEPGVKYFFYESLKRCKLKKINYFNTLLNLGLLFLFISIFVIFILYKENKDFKERERKTKYQESKIYFRKGKNAKERKTKEIKPNYY